MQDVAITRSEELSPRISYNCSTSPDGTKGPDVYLSPGDAGRFFACAIDAPADLSFEVVYACSRPVRQDVYDPAPARELLGFEPRDRWPEGADYGPPT